jgi:GT2 family glycosyltransferase
MNPSPATNAPGAPTITCDLSIIIVSWNVWPLLCACLQSIAAATHAPATTPTAQLHSESTPGPWLRYGPNQAYTVEVIVVDSASTDETATALPIAFPWVRFLRGATNLGFTRGNNWGYRESHGKFVFFLNPDTELVAAIVDNPADANQRAGDDGATSDVLTLLHRAMTDAPGLGMVGPQLRYGDGRWQNSRRRFPTRWTGFFESTWLGQAWPTNPWIRHMHMLDQPANLLHDVDWLNGAAMFCRRAALEALRSADDAGPFDEQFFMYSEELDLGQRLQQAGWRIAYLPQACILHYEGRSSEQVVARRHLLFQTSKIRYYRKYFGAPWAALLRSYLLLEYTLQIGWEAVKLLLRHKPPLRRARIQAYLTILRNGLRAT